MSILKQAITILCAEAGWGTPTAQSNEKLLFALEHDLDLVLSAPGGNTLLLECDIATLPEDEAEQRALLEKSARCSVGAMKLRNSILSLTGQVLRLHKHLSRPLLEEHPLQPLVLEAAKHILNDTAWWRGQLAGNTSSASASPSFFSMAGWPQGR